jgi:AcrR family transcriptional regulator
MDPDACEGRVADVALHHLRTRGFALTTLGDVARAAETDEAELRRRFGDEVGMLGALVSPLLAGLRGVVGQAAGADLRRPDELRNVLTAYIDALLAQRQVVEVVLGDRTAAVCESIDMVHTEMARLRESLAAATGGQLDDRIRAAAALGAMHVAVVEVTDVDRTTLRTVVAEAALAILLS